MENRKEKLNNELKSLKEEIKALIDHPNTKKVIRQKLDEIDKIQSELNQIYDFEHMMDSPEKFEEYIKNIFKKDYCGPIFIFKTDDIQ